MVHVRDEEWVDVVRGTLPASRAAAVAAHLDQGCARCARAREVWLAVARIAEHEHLNAPPNDTVRVVRAALAASAPRDTRAPLVATLVFDGLREARAGVRGFASGPRQLVYRADALSIDVRLEASRGTTRYRLIGQVADADRPEAGCGQCRVDLVAGDRALETTSTNDLGEFEVQFAAAPDVGLLVTVADRRPVHVPLQDVMSDR
jgi:hypothetical protein